MNPSENPESINSDFLRETEGAELLASLDEADREIDDGRGFSADQLRESVRFWARR
jgi:hypothetical protein